MVVAGIHNNKTWNPIYGYALSLLFFVCLVCINQSIGQMRLLFSPSIFVFPPHALTSLSVCVFVMHHSSVVLLFKLFLLDLHYLLSIAVASFLLCHSLSFILSPHLHILLRWTFSIILYLYMYILCFLFLFLSICCCCCCCYGLLNFN